MKKGFTLAEVLITLGIIGVVAALTIPTLINNYQKKSYVAGLQRAYSQIQQAFKLAMAQEGVDLLQNTELLQSINIQMANADQSAFVANLGKYLKIQKACMPYSYDNNCHNIRYKTLDPVVDDADNSEIGTDRGGDLQIYTADGMIYYFNGNFYPKPYLYEDCNERRTNGASKCSTFGFMLVDINGEKGPNIYGRDLFIFDTDTFGTVYLSQSIADSGNNNKWYGCTEDNMRGTGCAGRVFDQGWKMDY